MPPHKVSDFDPDRLLHEKLDALAESHAALHDKLDKLDKLLSKPKEAAGEPDEPDERSTG